MNLDKKCLVEIKMNINQIKKLMERKKNSRKGENGHALIIGGSEDYVGAVTLAGLSALRGGCDTVTIAAPEKVAWVVNRYAPDLITSKIKGKNFNIKNAKEMVKFAERYDAVCLGNGITRKADKFCQYFIKKSPRLKVVDADALKSMSFKDFSNSILTPHETELEMMLVNSGKDFLLPKLRSANVKEKADILQGNLRYFLQNNNVLLVKGSTDIILSRNKVAYNRTGNQGMTKAGTGDILAGLVVGFLAKTKDLFKSAVAGAFVNGWVGDQLLKKKKGYTFIASDIVADLDLITKAVKKDKRRKK
jgi:ADP-dependent NAD(P)H-hydrate dehydratase / NAD(P)H-hydrate epimerase